MKKLIVFGGMVLIGLAACKKDWECSCVQQDMPDSQKTEYTYTIKEERRRTAYNACAHTQYTHTVTVIKNGALATETRTMDTFCELK